jgi:hypothetical protein
MIGRSRLCAFLILTLLALQQSCGTQSVPGLEPASPPEAKLSTGREAEPQVEAKREAGNVSLPSIDPIPRQIFPESVLGAPDKDLAYAGIRYDTVVLMRTAAAPAYSLWEYRKNPQGQIVGFEFSNRGGNRILPDRYNIDKNLFFARDFQYHFDDRARQDIHLFVSDWAPSRDRQFRLSELMNSVIHFFPRSYVPAVETTGGRMVVTLPTGEAVEFDAGTHEIVGGVFSETPVDLNPDKAVRKFAGVHYTGRGLVVRANARGSDPRLGTTATITTGATLLNSKETSFNQCQVPASELWEQKGAVRFRFATDEEFDRYLLARCGFGIPKAFLSS